MSDKVIIDLTENIARVGEPICYDFEYKSDDELLPYPNAKLIKADVHLAVTFTKPDVLAEGTISCYIEGYCDRCLAPIKRIIDLPFCQTFYKDSAQEEDAYTYSASRLDATKAICDEIVLSMPVSLLCKSDCKGLCPKCGTDLNERQCDCDMSRDNVFASLKNLKF